MSKPSQRQNVLDYDDLLLYWAQTMSIPRLRTISAAGFEPCLVDEYQDTNRCSRRSCWRSARGNGLTVVGDDAQSIYAFRAATVRTSSTSGPVSRRRPISSRSIANYRSTQTILAAANGVIDSGQDGFTKNLGPTGRRYEAAAGLGARRSLEGSLHRRTHSGKPGIRHALKEQAVLFRTSSHSGRWSRN